MLPMIDPTTTNTTTSEPIEIDLTTSSTQTDNILITNPIQAFLDGHVGKTLGLTLQELKIGLHVAKNFLMRGEFRKALKIYAALVLCAPSEPDFQIGLAHCASLLHEHEMALQAASVFIALNPEDARGYFLSGRSCIGLRAYEEAEEDLNKAIECALKARQAPIVNEARRLLEVLKLVRKKES